MISARYRQLQTLKSGSAPLKTTHTIAFVECLDLDLVREFECLENVDNGLSVERPIMLFEIVRQSFGNMLKSPL